MHYIVGNTLPVALCAKVNISFHFFPQDNFQYCTVAMQVSYQVIGLFAKQKVPVVVEHRATVVITWMQKQDHFGERLCLTT